MQLRTYSFFPACAASCWPAYGFFAAFAEAGALWNFVSTSAASSAAGSRIAAAARACELASERMNPLFKARKRCSRVFLSLVDHAYTAARLLDDAVGRGGLANRWRANLTSGKQARQPKPWGWLSRRDC